MILSFINSNMSPVVNGRPVLGLPPSPDESWETVNGTRSLENGRVDR